MTQDPKTNERLIAAAPDLLYAARLTLAILDGMTLERFSQGRTRPCVDALSKAIAAAEGKPPERLINSVKGVK